MEVISQEYFEVDFEKYCKKCKHKEKTGNEFPCSNCIEVPTNLHSRKPILWEEKK